MTTITQREKALADIFASVETDEFLYCDDLRAEVRRLVRIAFDRGTRA